MSKRAKRALTRENPAMAGAVRASVGDSTALAAVTDHIDESELRPQGGDLLISRLSMGSTYWVETVNWVYIGKLITKGMDYFDLGEVVRVFNDGRHGRLMTTGTAEGLEVAPTGGPNRIMHVPIDWCGPVCEWPFDIPAGTV